MEKKPYRRKPKHSRKPPVWKYVIKTAREQSLHDAIVDCHLYNRSNEFNRRGIPREGISAYRNVYEQSVSVHVNRNADNTVKSVTLLLQDHVVRWNHTAQKHFLKDETLAVRTVFRTSRNRLAYYFYDCYYQSESGKKTKSTLNPTGPTEMIGSMFLPFMREHTNPIAVWREIAEKEFGESIAKEAIYPGLKYFGQAGMTLFSPRTMRADTASEMCDLIFGKSLHRKDLVKAVGKAMIDNSHMWDNAHLIAWVELFKRSVPVDWLVLALTKPSTRTTISMVPEFEQAAISSTDRKLFRDILDQLKPNERRNILFNNHGQRHGLIFRDTLRMYQMIQNLGGTIPPNRDNVKNLFHLHNILSTENNRITQERRRLYQITAYDSTKMLINSNTEAELRAFMLELDPRIDIRFARDYETLSDWSNYMNNCISSYFSSRCLLAGVYENGILTANLEIKVNIFFEQLEKKVIDYSLVQLLGKHNQKLDSESKERIESLISEYGIRLDTNRWA